MMCRSYLAIIGLSLATGLGVVISPASMSGQACSGPNCTTSTTVQSSNSPLLSDSVRSCLLSYHPSHSCPPTSKCTARECLDQGPPDPRCLAELDRERRAFIQHCEEFNNSTTETSPKRNGSEDRSSRVDCYQSCESARTGTVGGGVAYHNCIARCQGRSAVDIPTCAQSCYGVSASDASAIDQCLARSCGDSSDGPPSSPSTQVKSEYQDNGGSDNAEASDAPSGLVQSSPEEDADESTSTNAQNSPSPNGCDDLINYRDNELEQEFAAAVYKRDLFRDEKEKDFERAQSTLNLMNKEWLVGQTGAQIAIEIKYVTDEANAFLKMLVPESKITEGLEILDKQMITRKLLTTMVEDGAEKASEDGAKEVFWKLGEELSPLVAMQHAIVEHTENEEGMAKYKKEVQEQVASLVATARRWHDKEKEEQSKADSVMRIKQQITNYCSSSNADPAVQKSLDVAPPH